MQNERILVELKYWKRVVSLIINTAVALGLGWLAVRVLQTEPILAVAFLAVAALFVWSLVVLGADWGKKYRLRLTDTGLIMIDLPFSGRQTLNCERIWGVAMLETHQSHWVTGYQLQLATDAATWGAYYHKSPATIARTAADYEEVYINLVLNGQPETDIKKLSAYLQNYGVKLVEFKPSILGRYQGIPRKNRPAVSTREPRLVHRLGVTTRQQLVQGFAYFIGAVVVVNGIAFMVLALWGRFLGIWW